MDTKEKPLETTDIDSPELRSLVLFNSQHFWNDVVEQLRKATGYDYIRCEQIAMIAHTKGKAIVKSGSLSELTPVNNVLKEINLITEIV